MSDSIDVGEPILRKVDVGIVVALPLEAAPIRERLADRTELLPAGLRLSLGRFGSTRVAVVAGGVGGRSARRAARILLDGHAPTRIVAAGLAGGLDPAIPSGEIVVAESVGLVEHAADAPRPPRLKSLGRFELEAVARLARPPIGGLVVTSDAVVPSADAKRRLRDSSGGAAVEMESWWVAEEAARAGVEPFVVRVVCDTATETIPADLAALGELTSTARMAGAAVRLLFRRPTAVFDMAELRERSLSAADTLAAELERLLQGE